MDIHRGRWRRSPIIVSRKPCTRNATDACAPVSAQGRDRRLGRVDTAVDRGCSSEDNLRTKNADEAAHSKTECASATTPPWAGGPAQLVRHSAKASAASPSVLLNATVAGGIQAAAMRASASS